MKTLLTNDTDSVLQKAYITFIAMARYELEEFDLEKGRYYTNFNSPDLSEENQDAKNVFTEVVSAIKLIFPIRNNISQESLKHIANELCAPVGEISYSLVQFYLT